MEGTDSPAGGSRARDVWSVRFHFSIGTGDRPTLKLSLLFLFLNLGLSFALVRGVAGQADLAPAEALTPAERSFVETAKLVAGDGAAFDYFGRSVALDSDTLVVGAYNAGIGANGDQGAVYVFTRSGSSWSQTPGYRRIILEPGDESARRWLGETPATAPNELVWFHIHD